MDAIFAGEYTVVTIIAVKMPKVISSAGILLSRTTR